MSTQHPQTSSGLTRRRFFEQLGAIGGFDFRLQDRAGLGRERLMDARNQLLGMASSHPALTSVRPEGQEPAPQVLLDVDRVKARALSIDLTSLNDTLQSSLGVAYLNDFMREGRILRVQMQAQADLRKAEAASELSSKALARAQELAAGIAQACTGNRLSDISHAIQNTVESAGFSVIRALVGHGVGRSSTEWFA